ncbi:response regulator transcription factor [Mucilaginibacter sp. RB4R14]|uniref:response regulator n=1 Tax=Mucilaginibacter aurantiaciroseus TaxID=2949308 RepID=UPI00209137C5|nr:response regulator transcription factor [Mucilaginibacter aurantiaciroseus]MCO5936517.1 response regulator transcription factor [Mucilaginibacter aurantiaciroseus]
METKMIKILVVEDNAIVRELLTDMVGMQDDFEVVGTAENGLAALGLIKDDLVVDIVLADLNMKGMDGIELTENVAVLYADIKVIILTMHAKGAFLKRALAVGARGYLLKNGDMDELYRAIRKVNIGEVVVGVDTNIDL